MKNAAISAFVAVITVVILGSVVRAQIKFPDDTVQTTAFKCVPAGTGTWSEPVAIGEAFDVALQGTYFLLNSAMDCSGTLHWVTVHFYGTWPLFTTGVLYTNSNGGASVLLDEGLWDGSLNIEGTLLSGASISIDANGSIFITYLVTQGLGSNMNNGTPYKVENLTP